MTKIVNTHVYNMYGHQLYSTYNIEFHYFFTIKTISPAISRHTHIQSEPQKVRHTRGKKKKRERLRSICSHVGLRDYVNANPRLLRYMQKSLIIASNVYLPVYIDAQQRLAGGLGVDASFGFTTAIIYCIINASRTLSRLAVMD